MSGLDSAIVANLLNYYRGSRSDFRHPHSSELAQIMENVTVDEVETVGPIVVVKVWIPRGRGTLPYIECITTQDDPVPLQAILDAAFQSVAPQPSSRRDAIFVSNHLHFRCYFTTETTVEQLFRVTGQIVDSIFQHPSYPRVTNFPGGTRRRVFSVADTRHSPHRITDNVTHSLAQRVDISAQFFRLSNARLRLKLANASHRDIL
mgnify:CR=1 FL=1